MNPTELKNEIEKSGYGEHFDTLLNRLYNEEYVNDSILYIYLNSKGISISYESSMHGSYEGEYYYIFKVTSNDKEFYFAKFGYSSSYDEDISFYSPDLLSANKIQRVIDDWVIE